VPSETIELHIESNPNLDTSKTTFKKMLGLRRKLHKVHYDETNLSGCSKSIQFTSLYLVASNYNRLTA